MKFLFLGADSLLSGIELLCDDIGVEIVSNTPDITVAVKESSENGLSVTLSGDTAEICYGGGKARFFRALAILASWV